MRLSSCGTIGSIKMRVTIIGIFNIVSGIGFPVFNMIRERSSDLSIFIYLILYSVAGTLVIIGAQKRKSKFVFPLLGLIFTDVLAFPSTLINDIQDAALEDDDNSLCPYLCIITGRGIFFIIDIYSFIVIHTFYKELLSKEYAVPKIGNRVVENRSTPSYIIVQSAPPKYV